MADEGRKDAQEVQEVSKSEGITLNDFVMLMRAAAANLSGIINIISQSEEVQNFNRFAGAIREYAQQHREELEKQVQMLDEMEAVMPAIVEQMKERKDDPRFPDLELDGLMAFVNHDGTPGADLAAEILESAMAQLRALQQIVEDPAIKPSRYVMPNDAMTNKLYSAPVINAGAFDLVLANEPEITAYTIITDERDNTGDVIRVTGQDRCIEEAILSIWEEAAKRKVSPVITAKSIYRAMPGGGSKPTEQREKEIEARIEALWSQFDYSDQTDYARKSGLIPKDGQLIFKEHRLNLRECQVRYKNGGKVSRGWLILSEPLALQTAKLKGQIMRVPYKYLEIHETENGKLLPAVISMGAERQGITAYLLRRIETMKYDERKAEEKKRSYDRTKASHSKPKGIEAFRDPRRPRVILFDTLFENAGVETPNKQTAGRYRKFVLDVLEYYKVTGYIKDYKQQTKGRNITGVELTV